MSVSSMRFPPEVNNHLLCWCPAKGPPPFCHLIPVVRPVTHCGPNTQSWGHINTDVGLERGEGRELQFIVLEPPLCSCSEGLSQFCLERAIVGVFKCGGAAEGGDVKGGGPDLLEA